MPRNDRGVTTIPRNGSGTYSPPPGTTATPNTTISSAIFNAYVADITQDLNTSRPVSSGGTGSTSNDGAAKNLGLISAKDLAGVGVVGGTANAITLTTARVYTALADTVFLSFKATADIATSVDGTTLNLDGLGAKKVRKVTDEGDVDLGVGDILAGGIYTVRFDAVADSGAGAFILLNPSARSSSGILELLGSITASGDSEIVFDDEFSSDFDEYVFDFFGIYASTGGSDALYSRISVDGGSTWLNTSYYSVLSYFSATTTEIEKSGSNNTSQFELVYNVWNTAAASAFGQIRLKINSAVATLLGNFNYLWSGSSLEIVTVGARRATASRVNAIRFYMPGGTITGTIRMYGVRNS